MRPPAGPASSPPPPLALSLPPPPQGTALIVYASLRSLLSFHLAPPGPLCLFKLGLVPFLSPPPAPGFAPAAFFSQPCHFAPTSSSGCPGPWVSPQIWAVSVNLANCAEASCWALAISCFQDLPARWEKSLLRSLNRGVDACNLGSMVLQYLKEGILELQPLLVRSSGRPVRD